MLRLLVFVLVLVLAEPARAGWFEATTPHFVIDADTSETKLRDFAARLERFDRALHYVYDRPDDPSRQSNRVHVYAVSSGLVLALCHGCPVGTAGFYNSRAGGSVIFTAALAGRGDRGDARNLSLDPQEVLFHEYSHHFMFSNFPNVAFPMWFAEGFADFNANIITMPNGDIVLGTPANYRAYGLALGPGMPMRALLDPKMSDLSDPGRHEAIYGRGWLLMHYLMLSDRRHELDDYLQRVAKGEPGIAAGEAAFGSLRKLDAALDHYKGGKLNAPMLIPAEKTTPTVEVRPLSPGAAAMMPVHLRSTAGVDLKQATRLYPLAEAAAAGYLGDARVQDELAEAEFDAGRLDQADAACDRALAADDKDVTALLYKGRIAGRRLAGAKSKDPAAWAAARRWVVRANRADTEAAMPLILYYQTYLAEGAKPPELAVDGLEKAATLAGEDISVHWLLAREMFDEGDAKAARTLLGPIAYAPHGDEGTARARQVIALIDAGSMDAAKALLDGGDQAAKPAA